MNLISAKIVELNGDCFVVNLFNEKRVIDQKGFSSLRKAQNYCKKYGYEIKDIPNDINDVQVYEK